MTKNKSKSKLPTIEANGKLDEPKLVPNSLEMVWGFNEAAKYGTKSVSEYEQQLKGMNRSDLDNHARKMGVTIVISSERLIGKLVHEFNCYSSSLYRPIVPKPQTPSPEVAKILAEGR